MPTTEILLAALNLLLFMLLSKMALKARLARNIAMRLLTDDVYYNETRGVLIQKNVERARLSWGWSSIGTVTQRPVTRPQDPHAAWSAAVHTSTHLRLRPLPEPAPSVLEVPYALWATTWVSKDTPWSTTVSLKPEKKSETTAEAQPAAPVTPITPVRKSAVKPGKTAQDMLDLGMMQHALFCK
ncbi:hypothetical protein ACO0LG_04460 [Undibacterium sp. Ji42W]|uniref:hypothetical protein n=1 Tax=Undibacterium sp. Ji42W TaxID=3413039 RepID=UPI003BF3DB13